jgi:hypothetical protein
MSTSAPEGRAGIRRFVSPTLEELAQAAEVCYTRWSYMRDLDSPARFRAFQQFGVELCAMVDRGGCMQSVGYLIPASMEMAGETLRWHYMFHVAARPSTAGAGAMLVKQVMQWYPAIFGMGITPAAERLYQAFHWQLYDGFWRGVHPVNLGRMLRDYGDRVPHAWQRHLLRASAGIYNCAAWMFETVLSLGAPCGPWRPGEDGKARVLAGYLGLLASGPVRVADVGGVGRILSLPDVGSLRQHAAIWHALRQRNTKFCELLLFSEAARKRSIWLGYVPLRLPVWCWDKHGVLARAIPALRQRGISFLETDKVV